MLVSLGESGGGTDIRICGYGMWHVRVHRSNNAQGHSPQALLSNTAPFRPLTKFKHAHMQAHTLCL